MREIIVVIAHGTVEDLDDMYDFLVEIRRGRPPPPELVDEMRQRYRRVGGSPLLRETRAQAAALALSTGKETRAAMRLWHPKIREVVSDLGPADRIILLPLAPYSVPVYEAAARRELASAGSPPQLVAVPPWGDLPELVAAHTDRIRQSLAGVDPAHCHVILTAHSLPSAVIRAGDPYCEQFEASAQKVSTSLPYACSIAYQSQGADGGEWVGPDLIQVVKQLASQEKPVIAVAPLGFLSEHVETLYDLDVEMRERVQSLGKRFIRVPALGTHPGLIAALAKAVGAVQIS